MAVLQLILGPDPILRQKAVAIADFGDQTKQLVADMFETLYEHKAIGIGANMIGEAQQVFVLDLQENDTKSPLTCINPEIIWESTEREKHKEASLCFPGISAEITRPKAVKIKYQDLDGKHQELDATGWLATVIQHEMDYLSGKNYLDHLSKMKRDRLIKKMQKQLKSNSCGDPSCEHEHH